MIEDGHGRIVGVEVKASATVTRRDFAGLRRLAAATRNSFALGVVLYDHEHVVPFKEQCLPRHYQHYGHDGWRDGGSGVLAAPAGMVLPLTGQIVQKKGRPGT